MKIILQQNYTPNFCNNELEHLNNFMQTTTIDTVIINDTQTDLDGKILTTTNKYFIQLYKDKDDKSYIYDNIEDSIIQIIKTTKYVNIDYLILNN